MQKNNNAIVMENLRLKDSLSMRIFITGSKIMLMNTAVMNGENSGARYLSSKNITIHKITALSMAFICKFKSPYNICYIIIY